MAQTEMLTVYQYIENSPVSSKYRTNYDEITADKDDFDNTVDLRVTGPVEGFYVVSDYFDKYLY